MFKVKGQRSRSRRKVMYQLQKHYNTAMDTFHCYVRFPGKVWRGSGGLKLQCIHNRHVFLLLLLSLALSSSPLVMSSSLISLVGKAFSLTHKLFSLFFSYQFTVLSSRAVDGHQMYFGGSVLGKASTIGIDISPTPPLIFAGCQEVRNLASFSTSLDFKPLAFDNAERYPNSKTIVQ